MPRKRGRKPKAAEGAAAADTTESAVDEEKMDTSEAVNKPEAISVETEDGDLTMPALTVSISTGATTPTGKTTAFSPHRTAATQSTDSVIPAMALDSGDDNESVATGDQQQPAAAEDEVDPDEHLYEPMAANRSDWLSYVDTYFRALTYNDIQRVGASDMYHDAKDQSSKITYLPEYLRTLPPSTASPHKGTSSPHHNAAPPPTLPPLRRLSSVKSEVKQESSEATSTSQPCSRDLSFDVQRVLKKAAEVTKKLIADSPPEVGPDAKTHRSRLSSASQDSVKEEQNGTGSDVKAVADTEAPSDSAYMLPLVTDTRDTTVRDPINMPYLLPALSDSERSRLCQDIIDLSTDDVGDELTQPHHDDHPSHPHSSTITALVTHHDAQKSAVAQYLPTRGRYNMRLLAADSVLQQPVCYEEYMRFHSETITAEHVEQIASTASTQQQTDDILAELLGLQTQLGQLQHDNCKAIDDIRAQLRSDHLTVTALQKQVARTQLHVLYSEQQQFTQLALQMHKGAVDLQIPKALQSRLTAAVLIGKQKPPVAAANNLIANDDAVNTALDEMQVCSICQAGNSDDTNPILFCERCNVALHRQCYAAKDDVDLDYYCERCQLTVIDQLTTDQITLAGKPRNSALGMHSATLHGVEIKHDKSAQCVLCTTPGGALKPIAAADSDSIKSELLSRTDKLAPPKFAHVMCALWTPGVTIGSYPTMSPIENTQQAINLSTKTHRHSQCSVCKALVGTGALIKCSQPNCSIVFHPACAWYDGYAMSANYSNDTTHTLHMYAYCLQHTPSNLLPPTQQPYVNNLQQRITLRQSTQRELRLKARADLASRSKEGGKRRAKLTAQRVSGASHRTASAASTSSLYNTASSDQLDPGRCASCYYTTAELQTIHSDAALWEVDHALHSTDSPDASKSDKKHAKLSKPQMPYPHQRTPQNKIQDVIQCSKCKIEVHPICYGVKDLPIADRSHWACNRCTTHTIDAKYASCVVCGRSGGALKPVEHIPGHGRKWCHVNCAFFTPGIEFADVEVLSPVLFDPKTIHPLQKKLKCYICKRPGPCVQCQACELTFHPQCGYLAGQWMGMFHLYPSSFEATFSALCRRHSSLFLQWPRLSQPIALPNYGEALMVRHLTVTPAIQVMKLVADAREPIKRELMQCDLQICASHEQAAAQAFKKRLERGDLYTVDPSTNLPKIVSDSSAASAPQSKKTLDTAAPADKAAATNGDAISSPNSGWLAGIANTVRSRMPRQLSLGRQASDTAAKATTNGHSSSTGKQDAVASPKELTGAKASTEEAEEQKALASSAAAHRNKKLQLPAAIAQTNSLAATTPAPYTQKQAEHKPAAAKPQRKSVDAQMAQETHLGKRKSMPNGSTADAKPTPAAQPEAKKSKYVSPTKTTATKQQTNGNHSASAASPACSSSSAADKPIQMDDKIVVQYQNRLHLGKVEDISTIDNLLKAYKQQNPQLYNDHQQYGNFTQLIHGIETVQKKQYKTVLCYLIKFDGWSSKKNEYVIEEYVKPQDRRNMREYEQQQRQSATGKKAATRK